MKKCDHDKIFALFDEGKSREEIAAAVGCKEQTVYKLLLTAGKIERVCVNRKLASPPIHQEEIQACKDRLQIGETIWLPAPDLRQEFDDSGKETRIHRMEECTIKALYPVFLLAINQKGQKRTARYVDLLREEGKGRNTVPGNV